MGGKKPRGSSCLSSASPLLVPSSAGRQGQEPDHMKGFFLILFLTGVLRGSSVVDSSTAAEGRCISQYGEGEVVNMWLRRRGSEVTLLRTILSNLS